MKMLLVFKPYKDIIMICTQKKNTIFKKRPTCYVRNPKIAERNIDDTVFLVDTETDIVFYLNPLSTGIWQLLREPISELDVTYIVQQAFSDATHKKIAADVSRLINEMRKRKLVLCNG